MKGLLIAGGENLVVSALTAQAAREGVPYTLALLPAAPFRDMAARPAAAPGWNQAAGERGRADGGSERSPILEWGAHSPVAARALLSAARNRMEAVDTAALVCSAPQRFLSADPDASDVNEIIDRHLKSYLFLTHELRAAFRRGGGTIAFVCCAGGAFNSALGEAVTAAFSAFAGALFASPVPAESSAERLLGFSCGAGLKNAELAGECASFILKTLKARRKHDTNKWHRPNTALSLLRGRF